MKNDKLVLKQFYTIIHSSLFNMQTIRLFVLFIILSSFLYTERFVIDKTQAKQAFELINTIRLNPQKYYQSHQLNASLGITRTRLTWNDTLAKAAEIKAMDMAKRNYFGHVDPDGYGMNFRINRIGYTLNPEWVKNRADNNFESLMYNSENAEDLIKTLIIDDGDPNYGHRNHLLGIGEWCASLKDIGIGIATYDSGIIHKSYACILIAKHNW